MGRRKAPTDSPLFDGLASVPHPYLHVINELATVLFKMGLPYPSPATPYSVDKWRRSLPGYGIPYYPSDRDKYSLDIDIARDLLPEIESEFHRQVLWSLYRRYRRNGRDPNSAMVDAANECGAALLT